MTPDTGYTVEERLMRLEVQVLGNTATTDANSAKLDVVIARFSGRPSWAVVSLLAIMQAAIVGLSSAIILLATR